MTEFKLNYIKKIFLFIKRVTALFIFSAAIMGCFYYPVGKIYLTAGVVLYSIISIRFPLFPLFFIPAFLPLVNLAPWSGVVLFEEFDLFLMATLGVSVWKGYFSRNTFKTLDKLSWISIILFSFSIMVNLFKGILPFTFLQANDLSNYLSPFNSLRIGRSFLWAILLFPLVMNSFLKNRDTSCKYIIAGSMFGVTGVCGIVFWERGVINDILHATNRYELFHNLLDFSSEYRITALFSEMNTGGAAIDGYIAMSWVFALGAYFVWLEISKKLEWSFTHLLKGFLVFAALVSGLYIIATTFTRITYLAFGVSFLFFLAALISSNCRTYRNNTVGVYVILFLMFLLFMGILVFSYQRGGFLALFSGIFIIAGSSFLGALSPHFATIISIPAGLCVFGSGSLLMAKALMTSKWVKTGIFEAVSISMIESWILFSICVGLGRIVANKGKTIEFMGVFIPLVIVFSVSIPMLFGNRMQVRFSTTAEDGSNRIGHWQNVLNVMDKGLFTSLTGMGLGSFPRHFFQKDGYSQELGTYRYKEEYGNGYLQLKGGKDMEVGQRLLVKEDENQKYGLTFKARSEQKDSAILFRICHRNLMHAAGCKYYNVKLDNEYKGQWKSYQLEIEENIIKTSAWYSGWPLVFLIRNSKDETEIDIDDIALINDSGKNIIKNGDYEIGGQRWFSYNEFEHLAWHTKNTMLHIFFEQGALGMIGFLALTGIAAWKNFQGVMKGQIFSIVLLASIIGFYVIGLTDSPIDAPRVGFMYYLILMISFAHSVVGVPSASLRESIIPR
jgi:hypothetical protein